MPITDPPVVAEPEWRAARAALLEEEKALTRALDALAAKRRRLPMVRLGRFTFAGPDGPATLPDLFEGRRQLVLYHFMGATPDDAPCAGCSTFTDNVPDVAAHLAARDTAFAVTSRHEVAEQQALRVRFGWEHLRFWSAAGNGFHEAMGVGGGFGLSVLLRDGDEVFRTYETSGRGVDRLRVDFNLLDLTPLGRQEAWEDTPEGRRQTPTMRWLRRKDEYGAATAG